MSHAHNFNHFTGTKGSKNTRAKKIKTRRVHKNQYQKFSKAPPEAVRANCPYSKTYPPVIIPDRILERGFRQFIAQVENGEIQGYSKAEVKRVKQDEALVPYLKGNLKVSMYSMGRSERAHQELAINIHHVVRTYLDNNQEKDVEVQQSFDHPETILPEKNNPNSSLIDKNAPLTMKELQEMDGQPVWAVTLGTEDAGRWVLLTTVTVCTTPLQKVFRCITAIGEVTAYELDTYGETWLAYRHERICP